MQRRILELLAEGEQSAGAVVEVISEEFGIGQPAVWLTPFRVLWEQRLDALGTEIARGRRRGPIPAAARGTTGRAPAGPGSG